MLFKGNYLEQNIAYDSQLLENKKSMTGAQLAGSENELFCLQRTWASAEEPRLRFVIGAGVVPGYCGHAGLWPVAM